MKTVSPDELQAAEPAPRVRPVRVFFLIVLPAAVLCAAVAAFVWLVSSKPEVARRPPSEQVWTVSTVPVSYSDHTPRIALFGETVAARKVDLRTLVSGEVVATGNSFHQGGEVNTGDLLVELDRFDYEALVSEARANLAEARGRLREAEARIVSEREQLREALDQLALAEDDLERAGPLLSQGLLSQKALDDRRVVVSQREQAVRQRRNSITIEQARAEQQKAQILRLETAFERAQRNLDNTRLTAPFPGYLSGIAAQTGRMVGVNDTVATLTGRDLMDVRFNLTDAQYGRLATSEEGLIGRTVTVFWRSAGVDRTYSARIERVAAEFATSSGGVDVYARLDPFGDGVPLRAGAFVELELDDRTFRNAARLPETALYGSDRVYVVEDGRLVARSIELAGYAGDDILVTGNLKPGEDVLVTRISEIGEGLKVEVR